MANAGYRGMPLLSGPAPTMNPDENSCRKCNKEFNLLFARSRKCNHCGYLYCQSCTDYQALQPRIADGRSPIGYEAVPVCAFCIENLTITAAGKGQMRGMSLAKLRKYAKDYHINVDNVLEKDELIDRLIAAREQNGCLPAANEAFYRRNSLPPRPTERPRGIFSRAMDAMSADRHGESTSSASSSRTQQTPPYQPRTRTTSHPHSFPRPDLETQSQSSSWQQYPGQQQQTDQQRPTPPQWQSQQNYHGYSQGNRNSQTNFQNFSQSRPQTTYNPPPGPPPSQSAHYGQNLHVPPPANTRPRSASAPRTPTPTRATSPSPSIPTLEELLEMTPKDVQSLSISTLKAVLFRNHVNTGTIVEKAELVAKVQTLITQERLEREEAARRQEEEDEELREVLERSRREHEEHQAQMARDQERQGDAAGSAHVGGDDQPEQVQPQPSPTRSTSEEKLPPGKMTAKAQAMASHLERTGLCVICQDEEANIAIVDCGHLAMCRACSDLIMKGTRECPLCRTRIITEARLLRIFKA